METYFGHRYIDPFEVFVLLCGCFVNLLLTVKIISVFKKEIPYIRYMYMS